MLARLTADHARIRAIVQDLAGYLGQPTAPIALGFSRCRWALMRELAPHLACERLARSRTCVAAADDTLDQALRTHMLEWTAAAIQQRWVQYREATRLLLRRLDARMRQAEKVLFPRLA